MKPAAPPGWVNKMDEKEAAKKKKKEAEGVQWHSGILNCCSDPRSSLIGCFFPCALYGMARGEVGESCPGNTASFFLSGCPCFAVCFFRENLRSRYAIEGSIWTDFLLSTILFPCTVCQLYRQVKYKPLAGPNAGSVYGVWSSSLTNCHDDIPLCLLVFLGCCCAYGILKRKMGQEEVSNASCGYMVGVPCINGCVNRGALRAKYNIKGNILFDAATWFLCTCCALCQEMRHIKRHPYVVKIKDSTGRVVAAPTTAA